MTSKLDKQVVIDALRLEDVLTAYGIEGRWAGRWLRAKRCPATVHGTDAFGVSREGKWHCHGCDLGGGDVLSMIAAFEALDCRTQFSDVIEVAAAIAGVDEDDDFGVSPTKRKPTRKAPPAPTIPPLAERIAIAIARCEWVWSHLKSPDQQERTTSTGRHWYLEDRGIRWSELPHHAKTNVRDLGFWTVPGDYDRLVELVGEDWDPPERRFISKAISRIYNAIGVGVCVRHVESGRLTDIRARRAEPAEGEPKILGMKDGVTVDARPAGTDLVACYGNPHHMEGDRVFVVEGWADYLTACLRWPKADVLGAVDAGSYPLVASFAARYLVERGGGRLILVAQNDPPKTKPDGTVVRGAADRAVDAASKRAIGLLGPDDVTWLEASRYGVKDLNDIARAGRLGELPESP